jgi:nucleoside-diphosphate-sugar epimerase
MDEPAAMASYQGARVLVTGASGFIASGLAAALGAHGAEVHGAARGRPARELRGIAAFHEADLADLDRCRTLVARIRPDIVFLLASHVSGRQDLATVTKTLSGNLVATVNLLTSLAELSTARAIVIAGSSEEPRRFEHGVAETSPYSPYAAAKLGASAYAAFFRSTLGLPVAHARIFMGYGPGQLDLVKLVPYVTVSLLRGNAPKLSSGARLADWTFIDDIVDGLMLLGLRPAIATLDIGTGVLTSVGEVAMRLRDIIDPAAGLAFGAVADRLNEPGRLADVERTFAVSGWRPRHALAEGLARTVAWYRERLPGLAEVG